MNTTSPTRSANPFLPVAERPYSAPDIQALGRDRSEHFYLTALYYAQSLWLEKFPAKSLLLINRALSCHLPEQSLLNPWKPYHAVAWTLLNRPNDAFIGNPRRHYQHLATRMVEPHKTLRTWRAWACWYLACKILPEDEFPCDEKQIREEGVVEPLRAEIEQHLRDLSPNDDFAAWLDALQWTQQQLQPLTLATSSCTPAILEPILIDDLPRVQTLARVIWPLVYQRIISMEQIDYMLETMYALPVLRQEMRERGIQYAIIRHGEIDAGYLSWEPNQSNHSAFLHKLYLHPDYHNLGYGAQALNWVQQLAKEQQIHSLGLRVNVNNHRAIRAYMRAGFRIHSPVCSDIGNGFVMDDYFMTKLL